MWFQALARRHQQGKTSIRLFGIISVLSVSFLLIEQVTAQNPHEICVIDQLSRQVCLPQAPRRIISLAPSLTEIVFALNAGDLLVGRTTKCNLPAEAGHVQVIGAYMNPDLERVIHLKPDLVLAPQAGIKSEIVTRLEGLGIPVFVDDSRNLDDIRELLIRLGRLLARETQAENLIGRFDQRRSMVLERIRTKDKPLVLFAVGTAPLVVAGGKSFLGSLIREAGGVNIVENATIPFPKLSMEEVIQKDPDIILLLDKECTDDTCIALWRKHRSLKAVKTSKIYRLDADLLARPAPRIVEGLEQLVEILHPAAFTGGYVKDRPISDR